jgi:hypothetical protein
MTLDQAIAILFDLTKHNIRHKEAFTLAYDEFSKLQDINARLTKSLEESVVLIEKLLKEREEILHDRQQATV